MNQDDPVILKAPALDAVIRLLKGDLPYVKVGIMGDKDARTKGKLTNSEIGIKHEFGDPGGKPPLPIRSFLRMPLTTKLAQYLENSGTFDEAAFKEVIKNRSIVPWLEEVGVVAENVVQDAFASGGFGTWQKSNMDYKKVHQTLIETGDLRNAIQSQIISNGGA